MMTCPLCGLQLRAPADRCPRCGAPAGSSGQPFSAVSVPVEVDDRTTVRPRGNRPPEWVPPTLGDQLPGSPDSWLFADPPPGSGTQAGAYVESFPTAPDQPFDQAGFGLQHAARATAGARLGALVLDGLVLSAGYFLFMLLLGAVGILLAAASPTVTTVLMGLGYAAAIVAMAAYLVVLNGKGQTLGKKALHIAVVDSESGQPIGNSRAFVRYLMLIVMGLPCYLGFLSVPLSKELRGWHDQAAKTTVVQLAS